jgi:hypothetical protein
VRKQRGIGSFFGKSVIELKTSLSKTTKFLVTISL